MASAHYNDYECTLIVAHSMYRGFQDGTLQNLDSGLDSGLDYGLSL